MGSDVLVIGAGNAGLSVAYELMRRGIKPQIIEQAGEVGASWRNRHDQLRLNTVRQYSGLPDMPIPRHYGAHIKRDDYIAYLESYVATFELPIRFGVGVQ